MRIIAHRGASTVEPENTLRSFNRALGAGVEGIELDVQLTRDAVPVVIHDTSVDRTTNGSGPVSRMGFEELSRLDAGKGERIPSLFQALSLIGGRAHTYVELKEGTEGNEGAVVQCVLDAKCIDNVTFISFNHGSIDRIRPLGLKCRLGYSYIASAPELNEVEGISTLVCEYSLVGRELVSDAHRRGMEVIAWTVDDVQKAVGFAGMGVDGIITNDPERMISALRK
jgi:glycerophosphoryl diester phosphodiesterase